MGSGALAGLSEALRYDPRSALRTLDLADTYMSVRNYPEAERLFDRAIQLAPDWAEPYAYKAMLHLVWRGDLTLARAVVGQALTRVSAGRLAQALLIPDAISGGPADVGQSAFAASVDAWARRRSTATRRAIICSRPRPPHYRG